MSLDAHAPIRRAFTQGAEAATPRDAPNRWLTLFVVTRGVGLGVALLLLALHRITPHDSVLAVLVVMYGGSSILAAIRWPALQRSPRAWTVDCAVVLAFVLGGQDWRSAFYLLALSALVFPATTLSFRRAIASALLFDAAYLAVAVFVGVDWNTVDSTARLESFATHLMVPLLVVLSLAYACDVLKRLGAERERAERLAVEAERHRLAWELHDSAKQRIHAAHLLLSAVDDARSPIEQARAELEAAATDMDHSLRDLRAPVPDGGLVPALRRRAAELARVGGVEISVDGDSPPLSAFVAAHAYRVAAEAMTNAVRHADAGHVAVRVDVEDGRLLVAVADDGRGMAPSRREGNGLLSMRGRAGALGGRLGLFSAAGGGTEVRLAVPLSRPEENPR